MKDDVECDYFSREESETGILTLGSDLPEQPGFLGDPGLSLIYFGGKGGVGKTTCATASAILRASRSPGSGHTLVSTDPAHSLIDSLNNSLVPENLQVIELDSQAYLQSFKEQHADKIMEIARRGTFLDDSDLSGFMDLSLPGLDELLAFLDLSDRLDNGSQILVVDTAPTGHALRLLSMPDLVEKWISALDSFLAKHRYMRSVFTGEEGYDALDEFLDSFRSRVTRMTEVLSNPAISRFVPVMIAEPLSIAETDLLIEELESSGIAAPEIVINRLLPINDCPQCRAGRFNQDREIANFAEKHRNKKLWGVPLFAEEVRGTAMLSSFSEAIFPLSTSRIGDAGSAISDAPAGNLPVVFGPAPLPSSDLQIIFFAGKGGVGKTTIALATALRLSEERPDTGVLLFSTDPAHSMGDCLGLRLGNNPTPVGPGLTAIEMNASAGFELFKEQYAAELEEFFSQALGGLDVTFDQEVMERLLDLSPPGVDELMAVAETVELLGSKKYGCIVIDSAPTGHLVRLLEMPQLVDSWLKLFFNLFLKYRDIFKLPEVTRRLVKFSKSLKMFLKLLRDPSRSALYPVTIPTGMASEETTDLLQFCLEMNISAPVLFTNMVTVAGDCSFCAENAEHEACVISELADRFPGLRQVKISRGTQPCGMEMLRLLGRSLYQ